MGAPKSNETRYGNGCNGDFTVYAVIKVSTLVMWQSKHIGVLDQEWMLVFSSTLHTQANNAQLKRVYISQQCDHLYTNGQYTCVLHFNYYESNSCMDISE